MNKSDSINELAAALSKAQSEIVGAVKDSTNPHFKSGFASLESVMDCVKAPLARHGLAYTQLGHEGGLETVLMHSSGQWVSSLTPLLNPKGDMQGLGSAMTYGRRYALSALLGVPQIDDDGNIASHPLGAELGLSECCSAPLKLSTKSGNLYCSNWEDKKQEHIRPFPPEKK